VDHIGVDFLSKSMSELSISLAGIKSFDYKRWTFDFLLKEKKKVKEQLKDYDNMFINKFNKLPTRAEKEPLRPLYMYYKRLKQGIVQLKSRKMSVGGEIQERMVEKKHIGRRSYEGSRKGEQLGEGDNKENISANVNVRKSWNKEKEEVKRNFKRKEESVIKDLMDKREKMITVGYGFWISKFGGSDGIIELIVI
jgi:hypothetical protein